MALGRRYSIDGQNAVANATKSLLGMTSTTAIRPSIYDVLIGSSATPADNSILWYAQRHTAAGTSTAVTPAPLDPGDPASTSVAGQIYTAEPTYTAGKILFHAALNQRATHRAIWDPNGPWVMPATANNGITCYPVHASFTGNVDMNIWFFE